MMGKLSNLLVLCAPHGAPARATCEFIMAMREHGATIQLGLCTSDAALTRNNQAARAAEMLRADNSLEWVLWVDQDISGTVDGVLTLIGLSVAMADCEVYPSVSGAYINRHHPSGKSELAAFAIKNCTGSSLLLHEQFTPPNQQVDGQDSLTVSPLELQCFPALVGMGALLQHRNVFLSHVKQAQKFVNEDPNQLCSCVCQAHLIHASELAQWVDCNPDADLFYWIAEDYDYCMREFEAGRLVYMSPVAFGHDKTLCVMPNSRTMFRGLRAATTELESTD
jgi:hypothetical protein